MRPTITAFLALLALSAPAYAAPTPTQLCESAIELASSKYAQCRLKAESKDSKAPNQVKLTEALGKCSQKLSDAFGRATLLYGAACAATEPSSAFDDYLKQCSDDAAAAAGGASLPDYVGDLATCSADLSTCNGDLATCTADLATTNADLGTCESDLSACAALPPARLLKTGQTTSFATGTDGDLEVGIPQGYVDNGDGTISDTKTGLMWEKKSDDGTIHDKDNLYTWSGASYGSTNVLDGTAATVFLATLNAGGGFAGHADWRLPNRKELESLTNLEIAFPAPATFPAFNSGCGTNSSGSPGCTVTNCSCTVPSFYLSSSTYASNLQDAWGVVFDGGYVVSDFKDQLNYVRAVRSGS